MDLAGLGVKTVSRPSASPESGSVLSDASRIPMTTHVPPTPEQLALFMNIMNDPAQEPVYVHCKASIAPVS